MISTRNELRREAAARGATHILFLTTSEDEARFRGTSQKAVFFDCRYAEAAQEVVAQGASGAPQVTAEAPKRPEVATAGTCFFVNDSGLAVTNRNVVDGAIAIEVTLNDGSRREAMLVRQQAHVDLALLQVRGEVKTAYLVPADTPAVLGEKVFAIGFPEGAATGADPSFVEGAIGSMRVANDDRVMQTSLAVSAGSSGGALVRFDGGLVGVVFAKVDQMTFLGQGSAATPGTSFAVKAPMVQRLLGVDAPKVKVTPRKREEAIDNTVRATCRVVAKFDGGKR